MTPYVCPQCGPAPEGEAAHAERAHTIKGLLGAIGADNAIVPYPFSRQNLIDIRRLISAAMWLRSTQWAQQGKVLTIECHDLNLPVIRAEMDACREWWEKLTEVLGKDEQHKATWEKE